MVDFKNEQLYRQDSVDKQLKITFDSGEITNTEIPSEQFELTESLTSESQLVFGSCEASEIRFRIYNVFLPLKDKWLTVLQTLDGDTSSTLQIGKYKVYSDKPTADRGYRDVVAYDAMYDIINTDVASWYNGLTFPMSLKTFRDSFFEFFDIEQIEVSLVNDSMQIERTIDVQVLSGRDVIQSICEINGCFGHIARNGKFKYVFLETIKGGLYPSNDIYPANDLYPQQPNVQVVGSGLYVDTPTYEDFTVKPIDKLQIREKEGDIGVIVGNGNNTYIVEDNFLVYGKSVEDLTVIADNMLSVIDGLEYRPFDATLVGNPCFEVGDMVRLHTKYQIIDSYVLQRTLSGVQALRDEFSAEGEEYQSEKVNDIQTQITQLRGRSNILERDIEQTRSMISDVEQGLQSEISQSADEIRFTVAKTQVEWDTSELDGGSILYDYGPPTISPDTGFAYYVDVETGTWYMAGVVEGGTPRWYNMGQLDNVFENMGSEIEQNAQRIALKVTRGEVSSELSVEDSQITISGNRLVVEADNFELDADGKMRCNEAEITGTVKGSSGEFTKSFLVNVPLGTLRKWLMNADENGTNIGFADSSGNFYSLLKLTEGNAELSGQNGVEINGGKGSVNIKATAPISLQGSVVVSSGLTSTDLTATATVNSPSVTIGSVRCRPIENNGAGLGSSDYRWDSLYVKDGGISDSDANLKTDVNCFSEKYEKLFNKLRPITYRFKDGVRVHSGFISQEVEQSMLECDITDNDFAGFCKDVKSEIVVDENGQETEQPIYDENGNLQYRYSLRYSEFIALNTHMIQQAYKKIETQQQEIDALKEQVSFLMQKLGDDVNG